MLFFNQKNGLRLENELQKERMGDVSNPGRGWYRIYSFSLGEEPGELLPPVRYGEETLALVMIDIGAFRDAPIPGEGLARLDRILQAFEKARLELLLRIVYDTQGKGMENEPGVFSIVLTHIGQFGAVIREHAEHILLFQGLCVGSWGEMHTSKFLTPRHLRQMTEAFFAATERRIALSFRTPALLRRITAEGEAASGAFGFFDDAILADETHMGTFGALPEDEAGWGNPWRLEEEAAFLEPYSCRVPFGGEAVNGMEQLTAEEITEQLEKLHVTYLNCIHDPVCLKRWKKMPAPAKASRAGNPCSLYDWIGMHLGYRLAVKKAALIQKGKSDRIALTIANTGFACCPKTLRLTLFAGEREVMGLDVSPEELPAGGEETFSFALPEELTKAAGSQKEALPLTLSAGAGGRAICFANEGAGERLLIGTLVRRVNGQ